jgi:hypothetical protein
VLLNGQLVFRESILMADDNTSVTGVACVTGVTQASDMVSWAKEGRLSTYVLYNDQPVFPLPLFHLQISMYTGG